MHRACVLSGDTGRGRSYLQRAGATLDVTSSAQVPLVELQQRAGANVGYTTATQFMPLLRNGHREATSSAPPRPLSGPPPEDTNLRSLPQSSLMSARAGASGSNPSWLPSWLPPNPPRPPKRPPRSRSPSRSPVRVCQARVSRCRSILFLMPAARQHAHGSRCRRLPLMLPRARRGARRPRARAAFGVPPECLLLSCPQPGW